MTRPARSHPVCVNPGFTKLIAFSRQLRFEPHDIARQLDERGRYDVELNREFPCLIKLFHYTSRQHTRGATWHDRLELFMPLDGLTRFRMGDQEVDLYAGDLLVVDPLRLHHVVDFSGFNTRAVVISFMPEFVYSLGSPSHDHTFLLPFYSRSPRHPHVLRSSDAAASSVCLAMVNLLERYFSADDRRLYQAGCKAAFLEMLYHLARHFQGEDLLPWEFARQQERSLRLKPLFEHISRHFAERLTVADAAALARLNEAQFARVFKKAAGVTLVAYLNHVRLSNAARLLRETTLSIAAIANEVGFADQSYFDRRFKASFGQSPKEFREGMVDDGRPEPQGRPRASGRMATEQ
jgi:AraC-like DNA-binding protein